MQFCFTATLWYLSVTIFSCLAYLNVVLIISAVKEWSPAPVVMGGDC